MNHRPTTGRTVIVTGASRGLGRVIAAELAQARWRVFAAMRNPGARPGLDELLRLRGTDPASVRVIALDVLDSESIGNAVAEVLQDTNGRLDAVVASAGIAVVGPFEEVPAETAKLVMNTNFFGVTEVVRAALPALRHTRGRIVVISSDSGFCAGPGLAAYTASKYALEGWAESLSYELGPHGVQTSIIEPGAFRSDIWNAEIHYDPEGPYANCGERVERTWRATGRRAPSPDPVTEAVRTALEARRPKLRYLVGRDAHLNAALKRALPSTVFRAYMRRSTGIGR
jgi:NAD(P)-dependent dehydrogenase (short-subunit alcohol dehydrogenase family)